MFEKNGICRANRTRVCPHCSRTLSSARNLSVHEAARLKRGSCDAVKRGRSRTLTCSSCVGFTFASFESFIEHANAEHRVEAVIDKKTFAGRLQFDEWFTSTQKGFEWVKTAHHCSTTKTITYLCSRSGMFSERGDEARNRLKKNSKKLDGYCTSFARVHHESSGATVVEYCVQHHGHDPADETDGCYLSIDKQLKVSNLVQVSNDKISNDNKCTEFTESNAGDGEVEPPLTLRPHSPVDSQRVPQEQCTHRRRVQLALPRQGRRSAIGRQEDSGGGTYRIHRVEPSNCCRS